ncbi:MAG: alpha-mannosidase [Lentisphaerae bacterium]|nr:alpha-mannosidase [Lentisphaerota bacterium]MCP4103636.1 alpha-mannosidase [Lentisphaerota bacterium]
MPAEWVGERVVAQLNIGGEGLVFNPGGTPLRAITNNSIFQINFLRDVVPLFEKAKGGEKIDLWVDCAANNYLGLNSEFHPRLDSDTPEGHMVANVTSLRLCIQDEEVWQLMVDVEVALSLMTTYDEKHYRYRQILMNLNKVFDIYSNNVKNAAAARKYLKEEFFSKHANDSALNVAAVGHAHIDTGWLWPVRETIRKCGRTFANQLALIKEYPGYVFGASQPQHYQFTKDHYPELYGQIKQAVANGTWEPQGGMWVEADCNLISGESMIRQFLYGKNFFMDEFGFDVKNLWLPDVFGYSAAMPQIIKGCGCDYFITQKISWNIYNKFPHHTFNWRGIDGSEVLTHFPPEDTYNAMILPEEMVPGQDKFQEADTVNEFISLFGIGDGGGGPRRDYIERAHRMANLEGCPKVKMGRSDEFLERLNSFRDKLSTWSGELYLEKHQGTLTTQAGVKKRNRQLEYLLKHVEFIYSCLPYAEYPDAEMDKNWKLLLINQFHDIIPGSSIARVYKEAHEQYDEIFASCNQLLESAAGQLFETSSDSMVMFNPLGCAFNGPVELPEGWTGASCNGTSLPAQQEGNAVVAEVSIPAYSFISIEKKEEAAEKSTCCKKDLVLENDFIRYEFDSNGRLIHAIDKEVDHELIKPGEHANVLSVYNDVPVEYDAWDVDISYETMYMEDAIGISSSKTIDGKLRQILGFELKISNSTIKQQVVLGQGKRLDFKTEIEWDEDHRMLRTRFPFNVNTSEATFDIQYGFIKRFSERNTSWDIARYEVPAHRYSDISDSQYGIALLNDCKYGHSAHGNVLEINLLRAPKFPDFNADQGHHEFTYSLLPHTGGLQESNVINNAAILNQPPLRFEGFKAGKSTLPCTIEAEHISMEVLKKAEKEDCLIIRLVETHGQRSKGKVFINRPDTKVIKSNMIEWTNEDNISLNENCFEIELKPFEIQTYKLYC